jgi:hypothetical protein
MKVRQPNFGHSVGVQVALPFAHAFSPTPNMTPGEIAFGKGADAARRGLGQGACPYDEQLHAGLFDQWMKGFANAVPKADTSQRLKGGSEPGLDLDPPGGEEFISE